MQSSRWWNAWRTSKVGCTAPPGRGTGRAGRSDCSSYQGGGRVVDERIRGLTARTPGARLEVRGGRQRPPMEPESSAELFALAARLAAELGQEPLRGTAVGGASDGNYTAAVGCPTLDGLGAVGGGAHADTEYVDIARMVPRTRLLTELIARTRRRPEPGPTRGGMS
ncbi:M20/M25/M40 family metallo-hydrolase [Streptomyces bobili]|uniref:M20/M25/M40 family metallo-hydrolase n=1 Tax=Streptomyces bobili TaxID=67280 RepID=UPI00339E346C